MEGSQAIPEPQHHSVSPLAKKPKLPKPNLERPGEITEPQGISVPDDFSMEEQKDDDSIREHGKEFEDDSDYSDDPNWSYISEESVDPKGEFEDLELEMYENLEWINWHNKDESCWLMFTLSESW